MDNLFRGYSSSRLTDILLHVPPFFVMEFICRSIRIFTVNSLLSFFTLLSFFKFLFIKRPILNADHLEEIFYFILSVLGFIISLILFMQRARHLMFFYLTIVAIGVIIWSYTLNEEYVKYCAELLSHHSSLQYEMFVLNKTAIKVFFSNYISQMFLAVLFCFTTEKLPFYPQNNIFLVTFLFTFPTTISVSVSSFLTFTPALVAMITFFILACYFVSFISILYQHISMYFLSLRSLYQEYQPLHIIDIIWTNYHVSSVLQVFCFTRLLRDFVYLMYADGVFTEFLENGSFTLSAREMKILLVKSCDNIVSICGIASVLSAFVDSLIYKPVQKFLMVHPHEGRKMSLPMFPILIILTLQLGITSLKPRPRLGAIVHISMSLCAIMLYQIHLQICHILRSLSDRGVLSYTKNSRAIIASFVVLFINCLWLTILFKHFSHNSWSVPIALLNIEIIVSLLTTFAIYVLKMIDFNSQRSWYELYDYIHYLETTNNIVSVIVAVILFFKGIYLFCETANVLRLLFLIGLVYHNILNETICVWRSVKKRRAIENCVNSLVTATEEELENIGEVCVICQEDMNSHITCITTCYHFFHRYCLKKWLWEKNTCPVCLNEIFVEYRYREDFLIIEE